MTDWTIETDEEATKRQRSGAINGRYQICHHDDGLVESADTLGEAFDIADRCAVQRTRDGSRLMFSDPFAFEVYDRMARHGRPRTWKRCPKETPPDGRCTCYGDKWSHGAFWQCVEIRN